jgi:IS5 family transposase
MRFVELALHDPVPDAKTIWLYREQLARADAAEKLFATFGALLRAKGWLALGGQIIDATASDVWADTAYRSAANLDLLNRRGLKPQFQRKKPRGKKMPAHIARGNATRARVRAPVEHVFAVQKCRLGLIVRTVGMARARVKIGLANLAYNFTRLAWLNQ